MGTSLNKRTVGYVIIVCNYFDRRLKESLNMYFESNVSILGGRLKTIKGWCKKGLGTKMGGS